MIINLNEKKRLIFQVSDSEMPTMVLPARFKNFRLTDNYSDLTQFRCDKADIGIKFYNLN